MSSRHQFLANRGPTLVAVGMIIGLFLPPVVVAVTSTILILVVAIPPVGRFLERGNTDETLGRRFIAFCATWCGLLAIQLVRIFSKELIDWLGVIQNGPYRFSVLLFVWIGGWLVWKFKSAQLYYYGLSEVALGICAAFRVLVPVNSGALLITDWIQVLAATYLVSRGFTNCAEARRQRTEREPAGNIT